jgi:hypothetical protein
MDRGFEPAGAGDDCAGVAGAGGGNQEIISTMMIRIIRASEVQFVPKCEIRV